MRLIEIKFTEWRDVPVASSALREATKETQAASEREVLARKELATTEEMLKVLSSDPIKAEYATRAQEVVNSMRASKAAREAEEAAGAQAAKEMKLHERVGKIGYQIIGEGEHGEYVVKMVDADGKDLPASAVFGSEVSNPAPVAPRWFTQEFIDALEQEVA